MKFVFVDKDTSLEVLKAWVFDLPRRCYESGRVAVEMQTEAKATEARLRELENDVLLDVVGVLDERGKARFSSQAVREAEVQRRLRGNREYQDLLRKRGDFFSRRDVARLQVEYDERMFSVVKNLLYDALERDRLKLVGRRDV